MPHLYVDYSDNLAGLPERDMLTALNATICAHPTVQDEADLKARITRATQYVVGTQAGSRGFIHAQLRLLAGRTPEVKKELSDRVAEVLRRFTPQPEGMLVQVSVEIVDMDKPSYHKGRL